MKKVKKLMFRQVITVQRCTTLKQLLGNFASFHTFPIVPVVEEDNTLAGVISLKNLINVLRPTEPRTLKAIPFLDEKPVAIMEVEITPEMSQLIVADDIMDTDFIAVDEEMTDAQAFKLMRLHDKEQIPVIDKDKKFKGIVGIFDIVVNIFIDRGILEK
jgi:CBS-domain-containing membrane protein